MGFFETLWLLVLGHFICDYTLQSGFTAVCKNPKVKSNTGIPWYYVMAGHCATHAMAVYLITRSPFLSVGEFMCHFAADVEKCEHNRSIHEDQLFHLSCKLAFACLLELWAWK